MQLVEAQAHNYFAKQLFFQIGVSLDKTFVVPTPTPCAALVPVHTMADYLVEHPSSAGFIQALLVEDIQLTPRCTCVAISWVSCKFALLLCTKI